MKGRKIWVFLFSIERTKKSLIQSRRGAKGKKETLRKGAVKNFWNLVVITTFALVPAAEGRNLIN